jgi:hypothetical protein
MDPRAGRCLGIAIPMGPLRPDRSGPGKHWLRSGRQDRPRYYLRRRIKHREVHHSELRRHAMNALSLYWRAAGASFYSITGCPPLVPRALSSRLPLWGVNERSECMERSPCYRQEPFRTLFRMVPSTRLLFLPTKRSAVHRALAIPMK